MLYFATASGPKVRDAMRAGIIGQIDTPAVGSKPDPGVVWCADNAAFAEKYPGDDAYLAWLGTRADIAEWCRFAPAPDVVGDAAATLLLSLPMLPRIRRAGFPAALVAQNGLTPGDVPWTDIDALFIGGDTAWKLGDAARELVVAARRHRKWVHMGRVNSLRRAQYADYIGCDSVDGTYLAFGPDINLPKLRRWLTTIAEMPPLFRVGTEE